MKKIIYSLHLFLSLIILLAGCNKGNDSTPNEPVQPVSNYWNKLTLPSGVYSAAVDINSAVWAATDAGVYKSTNSGASWVLTNNGLTMTKSILIKSAANGNLYVMAGTDLFSYTNNTWTDISKKINTTLITFSHNYTFSLDKDGNIYYACFISEKIDAGSIGLDKPAFFKSTDAGQTWSRIKVQANDGQIQDICVDAKGDINVIMNGTVYHSTDAGKTFNNSQTLLTSFNPMKLTVNSSNTLYMGAGSGVYRSTDYGLNWTNCNSNNYCISVAVNPRDYIFAGAINACWISTDNGSTWTQSSSGLTYSIGGATDCKIETFDKNGYAYAILESVLYRSANSTL